MSPTLIVHGGPERVSATVAKAVVDQFECKGYLLSWRQDDPLSPGSVHFAVDYEPRRGGPTVCYDIETGCSEAIAVFEYNSLAAAGVFEHNQAVQRRMTAKEAVELIQAGLMTSDEGCKQAGTSAIAKRIDEIRATEFEISGPTRLESVTVGEEQVTRGFQASVLSTLADEIHQRNVDAGWWTDLATGEDLHGKRNIGELLSLVHSEISEALEGWRKGLMDDKLPHRPMFRVELVDAMIRILDILGSEDNDTDPVGEIFFEKVDFNAARADHKPENRRKDGGKKI